MGLAATEGSGQGIPCVYALLPSKKEIIYEKLFSVIKEKVGPDVTPNLTILTDFEKSVFNAGGKVFPDVIQRGCRFHRNAAIFAQVGAKGLQSLFYSNGKFQELVYKCYALCFVPADLALGVHEEVIVPAVDEGHNTEPEWGEYYEEIEAFGLYLTNTWLQRRGGRAPLFPPELWSQYNAVMEDKPQTNNSLERFNRTWNSLVGNNSSVWTVQDVFVKRDADARRNFLNNAAARTFATTLATSREASTQLRGLSMLCRASTACPLRTTFPSWPMTFTYMISNFFFEAFVVKLFK